ncbi:VanZ family protein [Lentilactobacillus sp. TOM.63]|uniref:VanZ family protein n=1 Tax=Lentilactobacillus sp. TOM.63 TaxID=3055077 RepID=UPI0025A0E8E5|nr:VanZ family protein [Lentilactobacillus sp. TOM.63]MDM7515956.1 VanZ family protein [Lentilactobacillus sp. TOM.63]
MMVRWIPFFMNVTALMIWLKLQSRRLSQLSLWQLVTVISSVSYVMVVGYLTLAPTSNVFVTDQQVAPMMIGKAPVNLIPFWSTSADFYQNALMMIPMGVYLALLVPGFKFKDVVLTGTLVGIGIESLQLILDITVNLSRWVDINDVLTNAFGVMVGWLIMRGLEHTKVKAFINLFLVNL